MSRVVLLGATGLIGQELLKLLQANSRVEVIYAPTRRPLPAQDKLVNPCHEDVRVALAQLHEPVDMVFCCLGITRKLAGSKQAFRFVDYTLVVDSAARAKALGATHLLTVSAMSASATSPFFYSRIKGEMEAALRQQGWRHLTLVRPSLLLGERTTRRPLEHFSAPLLKWMPAKWRAIEGKTVARALMNHAFSPEPKASVTVLEAEELRAWGSPPLAPQLHG